jgi:hypothetical protein
MQPERLVLALIFVTVTTVSAWITAFRMRRRLRKALGIQASETELTSISTWMRANEEEERLAERTPIVPR